MATHSDGRPTHWSAGHPARQAVSRHAQVESGPKNSNPFIPFRHEDYHFSTTGRRVPRCGKSVIQNPPWHPPNLITNNPCCRGCKHIFPKAIIPNYHRCLGRKPPSNTISPHPTPKSIAVAKPNTQNNCAANLRPWHSTDNNKITPSPSRPTKPTSTGPMRSS